MAESAQKQLPRRTFAIISHPDAGKTTLTEKFLLYGGQIQLAGSVTARKNQRATTSDWMEIEKQRGISISSTVLQFDYQGFRVNLLDTPGHKDFSEDTYRVLTAVDSAVMVIDAAKGIEPQTLKLFEVCRRRGVPIFTFMNKLDRPAKDPLELLDELERVLGIAPFPVNFPLGNGPTFRGVYDRLAKQVHLFERTKGGAHAAPVDVRGLDDPFVKNTLDEVGPDVYSDAKEAIEMLDGAGATFEPQAVLDEKITPVFFGSAMNNFGVHLLLDGFLKYTSGPTARRVRALGVNGRPDPNAPEKTVRPDDPFFSGFVFKIQANMDPKHRDRVAFIRVVSGTFERDMSAVLLPAGGGAEATAGRKVRLSNAAKLFGQERETVDEAIAGDIVGIIGNDGLGIGDTLTEDRSVSFDEIPVFAPEVFAFLVNPQPSNFKRYRQGLEQLLQEGVVQALSRVPPPPGTGISGVVGTSGASGASTLLAAVGVLQFEVVQHRLVTEYQSETHLERAPWSIGMWMTPPPEWKPKDEDERFEPELPPSCAVFYDRFGRAMVLMADEWALRDFKGRNPKVELSKTPAS
ncbi:MAG: peptide chain release factor 3 [Phycisphaerales bacterium]|nr:peptide chain release factor 3 [Phycisphaerales bacterium]